MAKKRKRGKKNSTRSSVKETSPRESSAVYEKKNIFQKIYDLSIGRVRLVALVMVLVGLALIVLGGISLFRTIRERIDNDNENTVGEIDGGIQTSDDDKEAENDKEEEKVEVQEVSENAKLARIASHNKSVKTGKWVATNYKPGDLKVGNYEVQRGDTLWEIAEAVYGSGFEWHTILNANSDTIGRLPNGSQALIVPGQVLVLPANSA